MTGRKKTGQQSKQSGDEEKSIINPTNALIGSIGIIIVALIGYLATVRGATLPIEATQTAEALHTLNAMTAQISPTPLLVLTPTELSTPSLIVSSTLISTSTSAVSLTTPAPATIFEDSFIDNQNNWDIGSGFPYIAAGKYTYKVECPASFGSFFCGTYVRVPFAFPRNFRMEIDLTVLELSPDAQIAFGFQMRRNNNNLYYITYFITDMYYSLWSAYNTNGFEIIPKTSTDLMAKELGSTNRFGVEVQDSTFTPIINEYRLPQGEDGNLPNAGDSYLVIFVSRGHSAMIQFDNLIVQEVK